MTEPVAVDQAMAAGQPAVLAEISEGNLRRDAWLLLRGKPEFLISATLILVLLFIAAFPGLVASLFGHGDPRVCDLASSGLGPRAGHPFGFDLQGCDLYANVIYGARPSISIGLLATSTSFVVSAVLGILAGYHGGFVDAAVSRLMDVFFGFPFILGGIIILTAFPHRTVWTIAFVLALFSWPTGTRLMRSSALALRDADYVLAARALGASSPRVMIRHVFPNAVAPLLVLSTLAVGGIIAAEASLTFLGVGLRLPAISWGLQLSVAQGYLRQYPHMLFFPALFLSLTVLAFILLGDALRDAFDPKLR
ncbi:MAG: ABC transporter permease [Thermoleophilia bacterium]|nr:ABC transporter permease [Thermoleophilia bacterium]